MSIHRSLKSKSGALNQHRNVLTRTERIAKMTEIEKFVVGTNTALGLPKFRSIKAAVAKKPKKEGVAAADGAAVATPDAAKGAAKPAAKAAASAGKK